MADEALLVDVPLAVEGGWPPVDVEALWARVDGDGVFVVENVPVFAMDLSRGDTIEASLEPSGRFRFARRILRGGHATFRLIALGDERAVADVVERLEQLGADVIESSFPALWAIDVPPESSVEAIRAALDEAATRDVIEFEDPRTA
ncbi:MAG: hypothetical protein JWP75_487 [Frondihabitans sp.]|nr:hypothetical protein [Frondihabitans sp.]